MRTVNPGPNKSARQLARIVELRKQNHNINQIAGEVKLSYGTVKRRLYQYMIDNGSNKVPPFEHCPPITRRVVQYLTRTLPNQSPLEAGVDSEEDEPGLWTVNEVQKLLSNEFGKLYPREACAALLRHLQIRSRRTTKSGGYSRLDSDLLVSDTFQRWSRTAKCEKQQIKEAEAVANFRANMPAVANRNTAPLAVKLAWNDPMIAAAAQLNETIDEIVASL